MLLSQEFQTAIASAAAAAANASVASNQHWLGAVGQGQAYQPAPQRLEPHQQHQLL
eukprot:CAMPEP_0119078188 /NCGR_PEP_ID=MMETSP1178-20130426/98928_1 /TAXON_ID=33656 /ORGANISM="unid sp, Strain CCMP2000" /LENGTH=55 /DNA_ID=CAMNT_0007060617 /DNA_START=60 /DNA_END=224 /DNA_ORIENTATION=+